MRCSASVDADSLGCGSCSVSSMTAESPDGCSTMVGRTSAPAPGSVSVANGGASTTGTSISAGTGAASVTAASVTAGSAGVGVGAVTGLGVPGPVFSQVGWPATTRTTVEQASASSRFAPPAASTKARPDCVAGTTDMPTSGLTMTSLLAGQSRTAETSVASLSSIAVADQSASASTPVSHPPRSSTSTASSGFTSPSSATSRSGVPTSSVVQ